MVPDGAVDGSDHRIRLRRVACRWCRSPLRDRPRPAFWRRRGRLRGRRGRAGVSKDRRIRLGLLAAVAFMVGLAPLMAWYELANVPLVALALLLRRDYNRSLWDLVRR
jgi:hypothetical protein